MEARDLLVYVHDDRLPWRHRGAFRADFAVDAGVLSRVCFPHHPLGVHCVGRFARVDRSRGFVLLSGPDTWIGTCAVLTWSDGMMMQATVVVAGGGSALVQHGAEQESRVGGASAALVLLLGVASRIARDSSAAPIRHQLSFPSDREKHVVERGARCFQSGATFRHQCRVVRVPHRAVLGALLHFAAQRASVHFQRDSDPQHGVGSGGEAFAHLHQVARNESHLMRSVHIDVPSAMTGVSRFGEEFTQWSYSKDEAAVTIEELSKFDFLLTGKDPKSLATHFELIKSFDTFEKVQLGRFPPQIQTKAYIFLMRNSTPRKETA